MKKVYVIFGGSVNHYHDWFRVTWEIEKKLNIKLRRTSAEEFVGKKDDFKIIIRFCWNPLRDKNYYDMKRFIETEFKDIVAIPANELVKKLKNPYAILFLGLCGSFKGKKNDVFLPEEFREIIFEKEILDNPDAKDIEVKKGEIEFRNINFKYGKRSLFSNFNLKIPKNKKVAFVGHSGCGKTTLVKLLYRLYDVNKGRILVDGKDIKTVTQESLRSEMSIVPQEAILFDDTIYNNVKFSNPSASRKQVLDSMKFAQLDKIVRDFPNKERTVVGERGVKLSGGEKQRVSIARAILADKKILVLDEATSALDSETEHEIQKDLQRLMEGRTSLIIAHRLSTIMHADIIIVMKKGRIVQMGKHSELIRQEGEYKKLWNLQKGGYIK